MPSFAGAEFNRCRVERVPNLTGAEFDQLVPSLTGAEFDGCRVVQHSIKVYLMFTCTSNRKVHAFVGI